MFSLNQVNKKKLSEDIPNTLKIPEKRISRSGRECRAVIPYSIDNPKHFSIRKLKNKLKGNLTLSVININITLS